MASKWVTLYNQYFTVQVCDIMIYNTAQQVCNTVEIHGSAPEVINLANCFCSTSVILNGG